MSYNYLTAGEERDTSVFLENLNGFIGDHPPEILVRMTQFNHPTTHNTHEYTQGRH